MNDRFERLKLLMEKANAINSKLSSVLAADVEAGGWDGVAKEIFIEGRNSLRASLEAQLADLLKDELRDGDELREGEVCSVQNSLAS